MHKLDTIYTQSVSETEQCGASLARRFSDETSLPRFVALYGDLGVGKTAFVRGFASVIAPCAVVRSPTFALVNEYRAKPLSVFHFLIIDKLYECCHQIPCHFRVKCVIMV